MTIKELIKRLQEVANECPDGFNKEVCTEQHESNKDDSWTYPLVIDMVYYDEDSEVVIVG